MAREFRAFGYALVEEKLPNATFRAFASDPVQHCAPLQEDIMRSRYEGWQALSRARRLIFDRSLDEDANVFCRMHHDLGYLDDQQYQRLGNLARNLQSVMPRPDLIIFMCPEMHVLAKRVVETTQPPIIVQNLDRQVSLYGEWLATRREEIIRVDNSDCSLQTLRYLFSGERRC
jgi:deoxyadenosine/deoxycytidine kinase